VSPEYRFYSSVSSRTSGGVIETIGIAGLPTVDFVSFPSSPFVPDSGITSRERLEHEQDENPQQYCVGKPTDESEDEMNHTPLESDAADIAVEVFNRRW
jgi:hypothetical protein